MKTLNDYLWKAYRLGFSLSKDFHLSNVDGFWMLKDESNLKCHPLETCLLGKDVNSTANSDISKILDKSSDWVEGYIDGFSDKDATKQSPDYQLGYDSGSKKDFPQF